MNTTGIILAGGRSLRLAPNKALIKLNGSRIIEFMYKKIKPYVNDILLITNRPEDYSFLKIKTYKDIFTGMGPLAGIHSGLTNSTSENNLVIACDLPLISSEAVQYLLNTQSEKSVILCRQNSCIQYLFGIYRKRCVTEIETSLYAGNFKVKDFISKTEVEILETDFPGNIFFNLNTPEELRKLEAMEAVGF